MALWHYVAVFPTWVYAMAFGIGGTVAAVFEARQ